MKKILIAALAVCVSAQIKKADLMQNQAPHWRKAWPQGDTDDSTDDENVINIATKLKRTE